MRRPTVIDIFKRYKKEHRLGMVNAFRTHAPFSFNASQHTAALVKEYKKGLNKEIVGTR